MWGGVCVGGGTWVGAWEAGPRIGMRGFEGGEWRMGLRDLRVKKLRGWLRGGGGGGYNRAYP